MQSRYGERVLKAAKHDRTKKHNAVRGETKHTTYIPFFGKQNERTSESEKI